MTKFSSMFFGKVDNKKLKKLGKCKVCGKRIVLKTLGQKLCDKHGYKYKKKQR